MIKVGYHALSDDGSSYYRAQGVFPFISSEHICLIDISGQNIGSWAVIAPFDVIFLQRPFSHEHSLIISHIQFMGKKVICDYDDDLLNIPEHNPAHGIYKHNKKFALQCIRQADEIWVSTSAIKSELDRYNKNIYIIPNAHNDFIFPLKNKKPFTGNKIISYRGGSTHRMDIYSKTNDLVLLASECPEWNFIYMGMDDNQEFLRANQNNSNVATTNKVPIIQYLNYIQQLNPSFMICPLEEHKLNAAKSNICFLEAVYSGSLFAGNKKLPEFNIDGIIDISDFINSPFRYLEGNFDLLKHQQEQCWLYIKKHLLLSKINETRIKRVLCLKK